MTRSALPLLGALAALGAAACTDDRTSIQIQFATADQPDIACNVGDSSTQRGGGSVDLGNTRQYFAAFVVLSALDNTDLTAGGTTVNPGSRNNFLIDSVILNYTSAGLSVTQQQIGAAGMVAAGGKLTLGMGLLTPTAYSALLSFAARAPKSVTVSIKLSGRFASGAHFETASFDFPLVVYVGTPVLDPNTGRCLGSPNLTISPLNGATAPACSNWGQDGVGFECACNACNATCDATTQTCDPATCQCVAK